ncbi:hypothetical protein ACFVXC_05420 [Streptomyces sp. NPDC058257]|uniref:hypothetical protein n=1 Tax=Streptomyces sp. NPDC058257 TaxID=3346409 RepID=UPI0036ED84C4
MAKSIIDVTTCDWHAALPGAPAVQASEERLLGQDKKVDLCDPCSWLFDLFYLRRSDILPMLQADVLDAFYRSAREANPKPTRRAPAQLALASEESQPPADAEPKASGTRKQAKPGAWKEDVVQVRCPLPHRKGHPRKYWVELRNRTGHAKSHVKDNGEVYEGPEVAFELQEGREFTHFCTEHAVCANSGGYGFLGEDGLRAHLAKSQSWQPASQEEKDAAETRKAA